MFWMHTNRKCRGIRPPPEIQLALTGGDLKSALAKPRALTANEEILFAVKAQLWTRAAVMQSSALDESCCHTKPPILKAAVMERLVSFPKRFECIA
jgi:hypothetical protein